MKAAGDGHLRSIQILRGIAALSVVAGHAANSDIGAVGVDIFFVISGFIMCFTNWDKFETAHAPQAFLRRRAIRIVPTYWLFTLTMATLLLVLPQAFDKMRFNLLDTVASLFFLEIQTPGHVSPLIGPAWTLSYEALFYVVFAALLLAPRRMFLGLLGTAFSLILLLWAVFQTDPIWSHVFASPLLLEFFLGCVIGISARQKGVLAPWLSLLLCLCATVQLATVWHLGLLEDWHGMQRVALLGVPSACIVLGSVALERAGRWPISRPLRALGDASYSIYLVQAFTLPFVDKLWKLASVGHFLSAGIGRASLILTAVLVTTGAGYLVYYLFEKPVTAWLGRRWGVSSSGEISSR